MRRLRFFTAPGLVLACALALAGCSQNAVPEIDGRLVHSWTDGGDKASYLERTFVIGKDGTFMANLDPVALGAYKQAGGPSTGSDAQAAAKAAAKAAVDTLKKGQIPIETSWRVTGTLTLVDGDIYKMDNLRARLTDVQVDLPQGVGVPKVIPANTLLPKFSGKYVKVKLAGDGKSFVFSHSGTDEMAQRINLFFGGTYHRAD